MIKKLLFSIALVSSFLATNAQSMTNLSYYSEITPSATTLTLTFDYSGVSAGDVFEWQLFLAKSDGTPDWGSGRNIAYKGQIAPDNVGSGTQTVTLDVFNTPVVGEVFTWTGKITLASDGSDTGYNNAGNLVTVVSTLSTADIIKEKISFYPNPAHDKLYINNNGVEISSISILDVTGKQVSEYKSFTDNIDVSKLDTGVYFLRVNNTSTLKFIKN